MSPPLAGTDGTPLAARWNAVSTACAGYVMGSADRLDAYLPWDTLTRSARHRALQEAGRGDRAAAPAAYVPVMVEFRGLAGAAGLDAWCGDDALAAHGEADDLRHAFAASVAAAPASKVHSAIVPSSALSMLRAGVASGRLERFQLGAPCSYAGAPLTWPAACPAMPAGRPGAHTLGIIDDGCCFAHQHFRTDTGASRVHALWDQSPAAAPGLGWSALHALGAGAPYPYGVELLKPELDHLLKERGYGEAAEQALYASIGRGDWGRGGHTHGARVMHLAVREHDWKQQVSDVMCAEQPIVFVQLPWQTVRDVTGDSLGMHVVDGARYIVARARELAGGGDDWQATINVSLGSIGGPHDGSSMAEQALADLVAQHHPRLTLVMAAGNTAGDHERIHAQHSVSAAAPGQFLLRLPPAHRRDCFVELWFDTAVADAPGIAVEVATPGGDRSSPVHPGEAVTLVDAQGEAKAALVFPRRSAQGTQGALAMLAIAPTVATPSVPRALAAPGIWRITVTQGDGKAAATDVHAWVERDDSVTGRRTGQQARFEPLSRIVRDDSVNDDITLSNLANADRLLAVGGYVQALNRVAAYSANGPLRGQVSASTQPCRYAVSDRSSWLPGVAVPGFYSGSHATINGTSAAAPQVARALMDQTNLQAQGQKDMHQPSDLRPARAGGRLPLNAQVLR